MHTTCESSYHTVIRELVSDVVPFDGLEEQHQQEILSWVDSGAPLCRIEKPATPKGILSPIWC